MSDALDLDGYFARIGYAGPREPTLAVLRALHDRHPRAIPFENLDPLLGRTPKLDVGSLQAKLVRGGRGGYCFEHNTLFAAALGALGFRVTPLGARVQWMAPPEAVTPRAHMVLRIDLPEGPWLADVGFGGLTKTSPIRLSTGVEQEAGPLAFRLLSAPQEEIQLQVRLAEGWSPMYRFGPTPHEPVDYEVANWWIATHPASPFTSNLMAAFVSGDQRLGLRNNELTVRGPGGAAERRTLSASQLGQLLHGEFGLARPDGAEALYARLACEAPET